MIAYQAGDLFTSGLPAIGHGCNCRGVMGAGIAAGFRQRWPAMYEAYRQYCNDCLLQPGDVFSWESSDVVIFNLATQLEPGPNAKTWSLTAAVGRMIQIANFGYGIREIGLPWIGCGIGGLRDDDLRTCLRPFADAPVALTIFRHPT